MLQSYDPNLFAIAKNIFGTSSTGAASYTSYYNMQLHHLWLPLKEATADLTTNEETIAILSTNQKAIPDSSTN